MSESCVTGSIEPAARKGRDLTGAPNPITATLVGGMIAAVPLSVIHSTCFDIDADGEEVKSYAPLSLLFVALPIALGFEFANGFRAVANAVATVAPTRSPRVGFAVVWSVPFNVADASSEAVTSGMIASLPVELVPQVGTRRFGLPASSSQSRFERLTPWRRAPRPRRERTAKGPTDLER